MTSSFWFYVICVTVGLYLIRKLIIRLRLSRAKHPSLRGHAKISRFISKLIPFYEYDESQFFSCDGAPPKIVQQRQESFMRLAQQFRDKSPKSVALTEELEHSISDVLFTNAYRVPFQFRNYVRHHLKLGTIVTASAGTLLKDLDNNWSYDLSGSYGVNVFGYDFYKACLEAGYERVKDLGPVLGPYHPSLLKTLKN